MAHLESYDSFQTKKAKEQKKRAKEKSNSKEKDVNKVCDKKRRKLWNNN